MPVDDDQPAFVPSAKLEAGNGNPAIWHVDEDCYQLDNAKHGVTEMTVAEAREKCVRQASCCRDFQIPALEDADEVVP